MASIRKADFIQSIQKSLQYISYYHPIDFIRAMHDAYQREQSPAARDAIAQILVNSRMCAEGRRPICQYTCIVTVFLEIGMDVSWESETSVEAMVNEAVRQVRRIRSAHSDQVGGDATPQPAEMRNDVAPQV